jgi:hypothetical protein
MHLDCLAQLALVQALMGSAQHDDSYGQVLCKEHYEAAVVCRIVRDVLSANDAKQVWFPARMPHHNRLTAMQSQASAANGLVALAIVNTKCR